MSVVSESADDELDEREEIAQILATINKVSHILYSWRQPGLVYPRKSKNYII